MRLHIKRSRDAQIDSINIAYYLADNETLALSNRFAEAVEKGYKQIAGAPGIGAPRDYGNPNLVGMWRFPVPGFPNYLIFYRIVGDTVEILHVKHGAEESKSMRLDINRSRNAPADVIDNAC